MSGVGGTMMAGERLARAETALLAALVAGGPVPPGFDAHRLRIQADALVTKRRDIVIKLRPDLVEAAGTEFRTLFDAYARAHPPPAAGARADAEAFAGTLPRPWRPRRSVTRSVWAGLVSRRYFQRTAEPQPHGVVGA